MNTTVDSNAYVRWDGLVCCVSIEKMMIHVYQILAITIRIVLTMVIVSVVNVKMDGRIHHAMKVITVVASL